MSVFLRAKDDKDGKLKFSYDLLGRFRNKKVIIVLQSNHPRCKA